MSRQQSLATQLSTLVVEALVRIGLTQENILSGPIKHDNLPWQIPPLIVEATLFEVPFHEYLGTAVYVQVDPLLSLWTDALSLLRNKPDKVVTAEGYRATSYALPHVRLGERQIYLSLPEGYPHGVSDMAGITISLECAHALRFNAKLANFVDDEDNYYAVLPEGMEVGVKNGLPILLDDVWDLPVSGMVQEMLRTPRGSVWEGCDYNIISKVRSVTVELGDKVPEAEAIDWALQTLRVIDGHAELLHAVRRMTTVSYVRKMRMALLEDAHKIAHQMSITDRQRVDSLKAMLVPEVLSPAKFSKLIYPYRTVPPAMFAEKVLARVHDAVDSLLEEEKRLYATRST